jgi:competence protein ComEC
VRRHPGTLRATILDVGKGDSIVIESPTGRVMVVDAGGLLGRNDDRAKRVIGPFLRQRGIRRIDTLLLTHPHQDHIGGAATLIDQFEVGRVVDNGVGDKSGLVERYRKVAVRRGVPVQQVARGNRLDLDRRVHVQVLHPRRAFPGAAGSINDTSIVLRVTFGRTALLLTGDAGTAVEDEMRRARQPLACNVLKVAHHGGRNATSDAFLDETRPAAAVISVNANNRHGHPDPGVLQRLRDHGAAIWRTDQNGHVLVVSDGRRVRIVARRAQPSNR